jgi:hypothetical protein
MNRITLGAVLFSGTIGITSACSPDSPSAPDRPNFARGARDAAVWASALADAPRVLADARAGKHVRGEQDDMLLREAELPGFGGFFIDSTDQVVVYMKRSAGTPESLVRRRLVDAYSQRTEPRIREVMPRAINARILDGDYTLSELIAVENRISHSPIQIPGYVGVGTSLLTNRVVLGLSDSSSLSSASDAIESIGVPLAAVIPEVWGEMNITSRWADVTRPLRGGIKLAVLNGTAQPNFEETGSVGFNVLHWTGASSTLYFLTAAHIPNGLRGMNGVIGDTVVQPGIQFPPAVGKIVVNHPWQTQCGANNPATGRAYDFCVNSDVVLASYIGGASGERKVGTSMYEGLNGAPSIDDQINNWYPISGVATPEYISTTANGVHKSGYQTGTTTGQLVLPDVQASAHMCWGVNTCNLSDVNQGVWIAYFNVSRVSHAGWGFGDSGGPVFAGNTSPYYALGIQVSGTGANNGLICTAGTNCAFFFSRWSFIEEDSGVGTLNPATSQSPPPGMTVSITGPSTVAGCTSATWTANPVGGHCPDIIRLAGGKLHHRHRN